MTLYSHDRERLNDPNDYPCFYCGGKGKVRKPEDRCPIEGYKGAPWHNCGKCNGSGKLHPAEYEPIVEDELNDFRQKMRKYELLKNQLEDILHRIDEIDIEFLLENVRVVPDSAVSDSKPK